MNSPKAAFLSEKIAFAIPLLLGLFWPAYTGLGSTVSMAVRIGLLGLTLALWVLWSRAPLTSAELKLTVVLSVLCGLALIPAFCASDFARAMKDWSKLVITCAIGLGLMRPLRHGRTAKAFGISMLIASLIPTLYIIVIYLQYVGFTIPTYAAMRVFKGRIFESANIPLNPIAFSGLFAFALSICILRLRPVLLTVGFIVLAVAATLTGSRTPLVIVLGSAGLLVAINAARSGILAVRFASWFAMLTAVGVLGIMLATVESSTLSEVTEGRSDLWKVAWAKFTERPLTGYGFESWQDDLASRLPRESTVTRNVANVKAGGYHNEFVTLLAEQGLIGFIPAVGLVCALFGWCRRLAAPGVTNKTGQACLFACLLLLLRALDEVPGLFGYGDSPPDYLAFCFVAIVVSHLSSEEDWCRSLSQETRSVQEETV